PLRAVRVCGGDGMRHGRVDLGAPRRLPGRPAQGRGRLMRTGSGTRVGQYAALLAYLVFLAFPFLWLISTAFKSPRELGSLHPTWIPRHPTLSNFRQAFDEQPLLHAALNSLLAAAGAAVVAVLIATPLAYVM